MNSLFVPKSDLKRRIMDYLLTLPEGVIVPFDVVGEALGIDLSTPEARRRCRALYAARKSLRASGKAVVKVRPLLGVERLEPEGVVRDPERFARASRQLSWRDGELDTLDGRVAELSEADARFRQQQKNTIAACRSNALAMSREIRKQQSLSPRVPQLLAELPADERPQPVAPSRRTPALVDLGTFSAEK